MIVPLSLQYLESQKPFSATSHVTLHPLPKYHRYGQTKNHSFYIDFELHSRREL